MKKLITWIWAILWMGAVGCAPCPAQGLPPVFASSLTVDTNLVIRHPVTGAVISSALAGSNAFITYSDHNVFSNLVLPNFALSSTGLTITVGSGYVTGGAGPGQQPGFVPALLGNGTVTVTNNEIGLIYVSTWQPASPGTAPYQGGSGNLPPGNTVYFARLTHSESAPVNSTVVGAYNASGGAITALVPVNGNSAFRRQPLVFADSTQLAGADIFYSLAIVTAGSHPGIYKGVSSDPGLGQYFVASPSAFPFAGAGWVQISTEMIPTASKAVKFDSASRVIASSASGADLDNIAGLTGNAQTQINNLASGSTVISGFTNSGNAGVGGTLYVGGASTHVGASSFSGSAALTGPITVGSGTVTNGWTVNGTLTASAGATNGGNGGVAGTLYVGGASTLAATASIVGPVAVGSGTVTNGWTVNGTLTTATSTNSGNSGVAGNFIVGGNTTVAGSTNSGNAGLAGTLYVGGATTIANAAALNSLTAGSGVISNALTVNGTLTAGGLTANTVPYLNGAKALTSSGVSPTTLGYLDVTSSAQTQINAKLTQKFQVTTSGLTLTIAAGTVKDSVGSHYTYSGGSLTVIPSTNSYVYFDPQSSSVIAIPGRGIHQGGVLIAKVVSGSSTVSTVYQPDKFEMPECRIPTFQARRRQGMTDVIALIGDSLIQGAGSGVTTFWYNYLLDSAQSGSGYNLGNLTGLTYVDYGIGGARANMGCAWLAKNVFVANGSQSPFANQGVGRTAYQDAFATPLNVFGPSAVISPLPTLVIIGWGANWDGSIGDELARIEWQVRTWKRLGSDVLLLTQDAYWTGNATNSTQNSRPVIDTAAYLRDIADKYNCALADTYGYVAQANADANGNFTGATYDSSGIHMNNTGQLLWAKCIRSVLNDTVQAARPPPAQDWPRLLTGISSAFYPNYYETIAWARRSAPGTAAAISSSQSIAVKAVGKSSGSAVYSFAGDSGTTSLYFDHRAVSELFLITEIPSGVSGTFELWDNSAKISGTQTVTVGGTSSGQQVTQLMTTSQMAALTPSLYSGSSWNKYGFGNFAARLVCTNVSGASTVNVTGIMVGTLDYRQIPWSRIEQIGTWAREPGALDTENTLYSNDVGNAKLIIPSRGTGLQAIFGSYTASGKLNGYGDGFQTYSTFDLRVPNGPWAFNAVLFPGNPNATAPSFSNYGDHVYVLALDSTVNGSAAAAAAGNERFTLYGVWELDGR
jgi:hypothetical protein